MSYLQSCFLFDYGNRTPVKRILLEICNEYETYANRIGFIFYVNNNPYNLEFYLVLEVENSCESLFYNIKDKFSLEAIKELSIIHNRALLQEMSGRRFQSTNISAHKDFVEMCFDSLFDIFERIDILNKEYKLFHPKFYPDTIFFSYSNKNLESVFNEVISYLNADSYPVFFDKKSLFPGNELDDIELAIKESKAIIFFIDQKFNESSFCQQELALANKYKKKFLFIIDEKINTDSDRIFVKMDFNHLNVELLYKNIKEFIFAK